MNLAIERQQKKEDLAIESMLWQHNKRWNKKILDGAIERIVERRKLIFEMRTTGLGYQEIAEQTGVSKSLVMSDIKAVLEEYRQEMLQDAHLYIVEELNRLDKIQNAFWEKAMSGNDKAAKIVLDAMKQRRDLLGIQMDNSIEKESDEVDKNTITINFINDWRNGELKARPEEEAKALPATDFIDVVATDKW